MGNRPFSTYNMKSHNQVLGQLRTDAARRRNETVLATLRTFADLPNDRATLYAMIGIALPGMHSGKLPPSVLVKLVRQVRKERKAA